jgi:tripartite-type tricarboxylate transporter receptor subunit TctC
MIRLATFGAAIFLATALNATAQAWPSRPVKVIVPYPPGGAVDVITRKVAQKLADQLGQPFVIENKPGATGTIGMALVAKAAPDGYTFAANDMTYSLLPHVFNSLPWDFEKDLVPVTTTVFVPYAIAVRSDSPYKTLAELLAAAKASPGKLNYGSGGQGTAPHFATESLMLTANVSLTHIPYKGAGEAMTALIGGQIDLFIASTASLMAQAKGGRARILAVSGDKRLAALPDTPTFAQAGLPAFGILNFNGLWAPKGTPAEIVARLQGEVAKAVATPDLVSFADSQGGFPGGTKSEAFAKIVADTTKMWGPVAAKAKVERQ